MCIRDRGLVGFFSQVNWIGVSGVVIAVMGLMINLYFQVRKDRREHAESQARLQALKDQYRL